MNNIPFLSHSIFVKRMAESLLVLRASTIMSVACVVVKECLFRLNSLDYGHMLTLIGSERKCFYRVNYYLMPQLTRSIPSLIFLIVHPAP